MQAKSKTILGLQEQLDQSRALANQKEAALQEEVERAQHQAAAVGLEKDQLEQVYSQENSMRRDLEDQVDQQKKDELDRLETIAELTNEIARLGSQIESMRDENSKIEQSTEYYESSFKVLE